MSHFCAPWKRQKTYGERFVGGTDFTVISISLSSISQTYPTVIYFFKVTNENHRAMWEIRSKLIIVFLVLALNKKMSVGILSKYRLPWSRIFYLTGSSTKTYVVIQTLLLLVLLDFKSSQVTYIIEKRSYSLSTKVNWHLYDMVKIQLMMINNVNIFTIYKSLL